MRNAETAAADPRHPGSTREVLATFGRLGLTSFGGPIAHLGYFRTEIVDRKRWMSGEEYADLVSLCQFLPGPASSQVGIAIGLRRAGLPGALAAWTGFTLPSAIALGAFALGLAHRVPAGVLHGLMLVAVAVVAQALWQMGRTACRGVTEVALAAAALAAALIWRQAWVQILIVAAGLLIGRLFFQGTTAADGAAAGSRLSRRARRRVALTLGAFVLLLVALPVLARLTHSFGVAVADTFYRVGSMVFGGGHVVLPLLESQVVDRGWVSPSDFTAGYGAAQAVPGPLFTFSAYLGASMQQPVVMAVVTLVAIFLPSFLLVIGVMPVWDRLRVDAGMRAALRGVNASVVGILAAAWYDPVITSAIFGWKDALIALAAFAALVLGKLPPWVVVLATAAITWLVSLG